MLQFTANPTFMLQFTANPTFMLQLQPLRNISGLKWGSYVGSPDWPDPVLSWMQCHGSAVTSLVALPTGEVFGLGPSSCLIVMYSKEKGEETGLVW